MRVALYEIEEGRRPVEVAINEAVEIAKEYCGADAPKFINGILGAIVREREPAKMSAACARSPSACARSPPSSDGDGGRRRARRASSRPRPPTSPPRRSRRPIAQAREAASAG